MKTVLLRLAGPMQAWGTQGRFSVRDTDREPSKSGVVGLVGAALGMPRSDTRTLARLRALSFAVRVDREGTPLRDYHTVGGGRFLGGPHGLWSVEAGRREEETALTLRHYLADASFLAGLGGDDHDLVGRIQAALQNPVWSPFLGRRGCPPSERVFEGVADATPEDALRRAPMLAREKSSAPERLRLVLEADAATGTPRRDDPESFVSHDRRHGLRYVRTEFMLRDQLPEVAR